MKERIKEVFQGSFDLLEKLKNDELLQSQIAQISTVLIDCLRRGGKVLFCGNGGSASDAQHLSTELAARFYHERRALFAEALHVNTSFITAVGNDYDFERIFARAVESKGREGDVLYALSTSGNSSNILAALDTAGDLGMIRVGMTGASGGEMRGRCEHLVKVPSADTPRIQEAHILIGHIVCELVEAAFLD